MIIGRDSVQIARPAAEVFDHISDGTNNPSWRGRVVQVRLVRGDGGEGSLWRQLSEGAGGRISELEYVVTAFERPRRYAVEIVSGPVAGTAEYQLDETWVDTTLLAVEVRLRPRGLLAGLTGVDRRQMAAELGSLERLREQLQGG